MRKLLYVMLIAAGLAAVPSVAEAQLVYNTSCTRLQSPSRPRATLLSCQWQASGFILCGIPQANTWHMFINGTDPGYRPPDPWAVLGSDGFWRASLEFADVDNTFSSRSVTVEMKTHWIFNDGTMFGGNPITVPACSTRASVPVTQLSCTGGSTAITCNWVNRTNYTWGPIYTKITIDGVPVTYSPDRGVTQSPLLNLTNTYRWSPGDNAQHTVAVQVVDSVWDNFCPTPSPAVTTAASVPLLSGPAITSVQPSYGASGYTCSLNFDVMSGMTSYDVIQNGVTLVSRQPSNGTTAITHNVTGLTAATTYSFAIKQYGLYSGRDSWTSAAGPTAACLTPPVAPVPSISMGYQTATVSWSAVAGATSYRVLLDTGTSADTANTSYTFTGLASSSSYSATVAASNGTFGPTGTTSTGTTVASIPTGLTATPSARKVILTWTPVTGATDYMLQRNETYLAAATMPPFNDLNLTDNTTYTYAVASRTNSLPSPYSATVLATTPAAAAGAVTALGGYRQITITWVASAGATHYTVYRDGTAVTACTNITVLTCLDTGRSDNTSHAYYVIAKTNGVPADASATVTAHTAPAQVADLAVTGATGAYTLTWSAITGADAYKVESSSDQTTWGVRAAWVPGAAGVNSYTSSNWSACNPLYWRVTSMGPPVGETQIPSIVSSVILAKTLPNAPTGPSAANNESASVTVSWSQPADNSACTNMSTYFKRRSSGGTLVTSSAVTSPYVDTSATGAEEWHYVIYNVSTDFGTSLNASEVSNVAVVPSRMRGRVGQ